MENTEFDNWSFEYGSNEEYEKCWQTGCYVDQYCPCCPHSGECSGCTEEN